MQIAEEIIVILLTRLETDYEKMAMALTLMETKENDRRKVLAIGETIRELYEENPQEMIKMIEAV